MSLQDKFRIIEFEVRGEKAIFTDPASKVSGELITYPVPTYGALVAITEAIYWKPTIGWVIDKVRIMNPIYNEHVCRKFPRWGEASSDRFGCTYLRDVRYQVQAHFEFNLNRPDLEADRIVEKHSNIAHRAVLSGGRIANVYLGKTECPAYIEPCVFGDGAGVYDSIPEVKFPLMFHGYTYPKSLSAKEGDNILYKRMFEPVMKNGVIEFPRPEECIVTSPVRKYAVKNFILGHDCSPVEKEVC